ncbi:MAG TPA: type II secretion system F family protein [Steroidobacteraceae bacterium]|nr:type II secretion system F family protein [Steroidobacteraceae bacterium]
MNANLTPVLTGLMFVAAAIALVKVGTALYAGYRQRFTEAARSRLEEAFVFVDPGKLFGLTMLCTAVIPLLLWFLNGGLVLPVLAAVVINVAPRFYLRWKNQRRRLQIVTQLPDVLRMLGSSLRAGTSLQIALDIAIRETPAPLSQELGVVVREQRLGLALEDALDSMAARLKLEEVELVVAAMTIAREVGGNLAETLDQLATTLRAKATMEGKIRSLTSQGKLQGWIVGSLPLFLMLVLSYMQHDAMKPLFHTLIGWLVLVLIGILEMVGFAMIRKIVTIDV